MVRSHRVDPQRALLDLAGRQERFFYSNNAYTATFSDLSATTDMAGKYYSIAIPSASSTDYTMTATAVGTQQRDDPQCQSISLDRSGLQTSTGSVANDPKCWGN
ncbi:MAG: type IV pilin protein [Pseudomonadota bacterium]|nr:type IV pilin protein [Pseudomonadota bacterium]